MGRRKAACIEMRQKPIKTFLVGRAEKEFKVEAHRFILENGRIIFLREGEIEAVFDGFDYIICQTDRSASPAISEQPQPLLSAQKAQSQTIPFPTPSPE